jgi:hypothetical protein
MGNVEKCIITKGCIENNDKPELVYNENRPTLRKTTIKTKTQNSQKLA